jgi:hypothetical protein
MKPLAQTTKDALAWHHRYRPDLSPSGLHAWLEKRYGRKFRIPSASTIARVLEERGLVAPLGRPLPAGFVPAVHGVEAPNQVWCAGVDDVIVCKSGERLRPYWILDGFTGYVIRLDFHAEEFTYINMDASFRGAFRAVGQPVEVRARPTGEPFSSDDPIGLTDTVLWLVRCGIRVNRRPRAPFARVEHRVTAADDPGHLLQQFDAYRNLRNREPGPASYVRSSIPMYKVLIPIDRDFLGVEVKVDDRGRIAWKGRKVYIGRALAFHYVTLYRWGRHRTEVRIGPFSVGLLDDRDPKRGLIPGPTPAVLSWTDPVEVNWDELWPEPTPAAPRGARSGSPRGRSRAPRRGPSSEPST